MSRDFCHKERERDRERELSDSPRAGERASDLVIMSAV